MHAQVSTESIREAINKVTSVVDRKNTRPILAYTLVEASDGQISFSATDLEVSAKVTIEAITEVPGSFCVNAKNFSDILRELPNSNLELKLDEKENSLKINCGDIHFTLLIYKNEDFPQLVFQNKSNEFSVPSEKLQEIISKTSHAVSTDETRLFLNGIYLQEIDSKLRAVATDGHRLSMIDTEIEDNNIDNLINGIIVPRKGVNELKRVAESYPKSPINISVDDSFMYVNCDEKYFLSIRLISREYPKYQAVIPQKTTYSMTTDKGSLFDALRRIKIMSNEKSHGVRVKFAEREIVLMANHPSLGDAMEKIAVDYNGKEMEIGFNAKYLIDTLATFDDGEIQFEINNEFSAVVIKSPGIPHMLGIIMPLKL
ncbi:MAG: DNA polymerase III subunit beta [Bdellovibrionota bacterium]|jgi:DNA polymerase-3 subunit beta|nr:DNA polymerase III subunit beta [Bdellovibrionota bacterium]